jgi:enamine deaminase RidA (YjgF/YER057c/UK114 family)
MPTSAHGFGPARSDTDLFVEVFGARGRHGRSAIGVSSLPHQIPIEIEAIVEISL